MADVYDTDEMTAGAGSGVGRLQKARRVDVSGEVDESRLAGIGADVVRDWEADKASNQDWRTRAEKALSDAAQETPPDKTTPFLRGSSNVRYPLLTISSLAFASRAAPAIMKGDEAVRAKTFGRDPSGKKQARATRVADYMNWKLFYDMEGWEQDTDAMLLRLPAIGQHYREVGWDPVEGKPFIDSISALRLTIPADAPSLKRSPRTTHDFDRYPYELQRLMASGVYRDVDLVPEGEDEQASRIILKQRRMMDLDDDGIDEPYVVTVDYSTSTVLRLEEDFADEDIQTAEDGNTIIGFRRECPYVDYGFIPDPKGRIYNIGFGHLLTAIMRVIDTTINMQIDAGHAQVAGGGFIASEVRLQSAGKNAGVLRFQPGEYKTVAASGAELRNAIYERTFPEPSPVLFQLLGLLMEAAKDIASVNEAITGDAARTAPVGTTLALIEQGQQVFNGIYKRIYRALREEFRLLSKVIARYCDPEEYARFCDVEPEMMGHNGGPAMQEADPQPAPPTMDPVALFEGDFNDDDLDIRPVSDPSTVTKAQMLARAQFVLSLINTGQVNPKAAVREALEAASVENVDELMTMPQQGPDPVQLQMVALQAALTEAQTQLASANAQLSVAKAAQIANQSTGAEADAQIAKTHSEVTLNQAKAMQIAADSVVDPEANDAERG